MRLVSKSCQQSAKTYIIGLGKFYLIYYLHFILNSQFAMATKSLNKIAITGQELETETISSDRTSDGRLFVDVFMSF